MYPTRLPYLSLLSLLFFACLDDDDPIIFTQQPPTIMTDTITFLALGDSYTIGTSVEEIESWPALLAAQLSTASGDPALKKYETTPDVVATNGWTTRDLSNGINARTDLHPNYDLVSLLIGVNNQFQGRSISEYRAEFEQLLNRAITFAGDDRSKVFVVSIPDYAYTGFGGGNPEISAGVRQFNTAAREIADGYNITFLNITPISQEGLSDPSLVASDNLHPSGKQYRRWVEEVIEIPVRSILSN